MKRIEFPKIVFLLTAFLWTSLSAGDFAVDTDRLKTNPFYDGYFSVYSGAGLDAGLLDINFIMKYQPEPLATFDAQGDVLRSVVTNQFMADLAIAYSPVKWLDIGFVLPIIMYQNGDGWEKGGSIPSGGIGDMRLVPRFQLVNAGKGLFALSIITELSAPTGKLVHETMGASQFSFKPAIALGSESKWIGFAANFFYQVLEKQKYAGSVFDDEFGAKAALSVHAVPGLFDITGEFISSTSISDPFDNKAVDNIELGGGFRVKTPVSLDIVAGAFGGLGSAVGVPKYRVFMGISWNMNVLDKKNADPKPEVKAEPKPEPKPEIKPEPKPEPKPEVKAEPKPEPKPEIKPEPKPEPKPEVKAEPKPEPEPEVKAEPKPEPKPEVKTEPKPEVKAEPKPEPKKIAKTGEKLQSVVRFQKGTDYIADPIEIEKVAMLLSRNFTLKVRIEGHNDITENARFSQKRAEAVKAILIKNGVEPGRIVIKAIGASEPVATGDTDIDLEKNRRVEFYIINN